jgi:sec-independent protein translocase protein TatB
MFDIGWSELLVIGALALIVVGPKDLPVMLRTLGRYVGKARGMARDFQRTMEDAAREADVKELRDVQRSMTDFSRRIGGDAPKRYAESLMKDPKAKKKPEAEGAKSPEPGSLDAADEVENAAHEAEQAAKRKAEVEAARLAEIERGAAELERDGEAPPEPPRRGDAAPKTGA